jgi:membrane-bound lytic murein transglycosylase MltF
VVGFCQTVNAQAAFAPKMFAQHPKMYAKLQVPSKQEFICLDKLLTQESHWNPKARNKSSGAYGIFQFMPTTWGNYKIHKTSNPIKQINYGLHYISVRYGSTCRAWTHEQKYGWY